MKKYGLAIGLLLCGSLAMAQMEISAGSAYEFPLGELHWIFKPTQGYSLSMAEVTEERKSQTSWGVELGYVRFQPREDTLYFLLSETEYGTLRYYNYHIFQLSTVYRHDFLLGKKLVLSLGTGMGYHYVSFMYDLHAYTSEEGQVIEGRFALSPRVGLRMNFSKSVGMFLQSKYNFMLSVGSLAEGSASYNPSAGLYNHYLSHGLGMFYKF